MSNPNPEIRVGAGVGTWSGYALSAATFLGAAASFATTLSGSLPEGVSPTVGAVITGIAGALSFLAAAATTASRTSWAKAKAQVLAGDGGGAFETIEEGFDADDDELTA